MLNDDGHHGFLYICLSDSVYENIKNIPVFYIAKELILSHRIAFVRAGYFFMIVRKYTDGTSNLEVSINEENTLLIFEVETDGIYCTVELSYKDANDLRDRLYDLIKEIEPKKEKANG